MSQGITDNLDVLLAVLPQRVSQQVQELGRTGQLLEVIIDLGACPRRVTLTERWCCPNQRWPQPTLMRW